MMIIVLIVMLLLFWWCLIIVGVKYVDQGYFVGLVGVFVVDVGGWDVVFEQIVCWI